MRLPSLATISPAQIVSASDTELNIDVNYASRGLHSGSIPAALPQDCFFPWRLCFFELASPLVREHSSDAISKKILAEISLDEILDSQEQNKPTREIPTRDNVLHGSTDRVTLQRVIEDLPPGYRIISVLHDIEGYEHNEIAEMLVCSIRKQQVSIT